ncbi:EF-hand domain-containing protein [Rheinheimera sp.]|uniref:EF-hand domain-containing protein n=1 Tax=Rheinheimera sp. TaxID=1869214 RepID=UPI003AF4A2C9
MKTMNKALSLFLAVSSCYLVAAEPAKSKAVHQPTPESKASFIRDYDLNKDGTVTAEEFAQVRQQRFSSGDENQDGVLQLDEYVNEYANRLDKRLHAEREGQIKQTHTRIGALDKDKSGSISLAEYQDSGERAFNFIDTNKDGVISKADPAPKRPAGEKPEPVRARPALVMPTTHSVAGMLAMYDKDGDGKVTKEEYLAERTAAFKRTDLDGNGDLSADEYLNEFVDRLDRQIAKTRQSQLKQAEVRFAALDKDKNQQISAAEYQASGDRMFARWDTNADKAVSMKEALPAIEPSQRAD